MSWNWIGPYKLRDLLDRIGGAEPRIFPEDKGLYVFSLNSWTKEPNDLLYLGSAHATDSTNLCHRMGNEVISALGFHGAIAGAGSGGIKLSEHCRREDTNPLDLRLAWCIFSEGMCPVPDERALYEQHKNKRSPRLLNEKLPTCSAGCNRLTTP